MLSRDLQLTPGPREYLASASQGPPQPVARAQPVIHITCHGFKKNKRGPDAIENTNSKKHKRGHD